MMLKFPEVVKHSKRTAMDDTKAKAYNTYAAP